MALLLECQAAEWMALQRRLLCAQTLSPDLLQAISVPGFPALVKPSCLPANRPLFRRAGDTGLPANILTSNMVAGSSPHPTVVPDASQSCYLQGSSRKATLYVRCCIRLYTACSYR